MLPGAEPVSPLMARICAAMIDHPRSSAQDLADIVYADDPTGGPNDAARAISVTICKQRDRLAAYNLRIVSQGGGGSGAYWLERLTDPAEFAALFEAA